MSPGADEEDEPPITRAAHAAHFLSRLDRVDFRQTDLALRLYRDPELVRALLGDAALSSSADSIAVPLAEGDDAPRVVIARDRGAFVTCLGAGMRLDEATPVLPWARLAVHLARADTLARAGKLLETDGGKDVYRRIIGAGAALSREDFAVALAIQPALGLETLALYRDALESARRGARLVARLKRYRPEYEAALRAFFDVFHALGHLVLLATSDGHEDVKRWEAAFEGGDGFADMALLPAFFGYLPLALRAMWATARGGKRALVALKDRLAETTEFGLFLPRATAVACIGFRHRALRAEAANALAPQRLAAPLAADEAAQRWARTMQQMLRGEAFPLPEDPADRALALRLRAAASFLLAGAGADADLDEAEARRLASVPHFFASVANTPVRFHDHPRYVEPLVLGAAAIASQSPEEFYYPRAQIDLATAYSPGFAVNLARFERPASPRVHAEKKVGRNDPCPCGSGRKHKRCCGA